MRRPGAGSRALAMAAGLLSLAFSVALPAQKDDDSTTQDLLKAFEAMSQELEKFQTGETTQPPDVVMIESSGEYPPGRYMGRCEAKRKLEEPVIGERYEVRYIHSGFFRQEADGQWNGVGGNDPDPGVPEYVCVANEENNHRGIYLGAPHKGNIRGPGRYKLRVTGYIKWYEVRKCITVGGGPCPELVSREEIDYEIPFSIVP